MKDPIAYYFIIPAILLVAQVIAIILYTLIGQRLIRAYQRWYSRFERPPGFNIPSALDLDREAEAQRQARIKENHTRLVTQGDTEND